ncbi:hypothetical protein [Paenibacillus sp.]|uniref:hypothetical protein n=1 Tax=Paenibacillus sp. TaxID=58172 RepID=UPI002811BC92|nr:hypothetical protein [Paenibacillus sp.]
MRRIYAAVFAIIMPGLGQIYNGQILKGFAYLIIEHVVNTLARINQSIYLDFNGLHAEALQNVNYQFALFYPGIYIIGILDAYRNAVKDVPPAPAVDPYFIAAGFLGTVSVIYPRFLPFPLLLGGGAIIVPILIGVWIHRKT